MSITHTLRLGTTSDASRTLDGSQLEVGDSEIVIDTSFAASTVHEDLPEAFTVANVQSIILLATANLTILVNGTNEIQSLSTTGTVTAGTFTITWSGQTTAAINWNANAAAVQSALEALSNIAVGDVLCGGGPLPATPVTITFKGLLAYTNVAAITTTDTLTGGATAVATSTAGVAPDSTINLLAGSPLMWSRSQGYYACPIGANSTTWRISCTAAARLKGKILLS